MIVFWIFSSAFLAFFFIMLHALVTRSLDPQQPGNSMKRFWLFFILRIVLIGLYFWQLVQQNFTILLTGLIVFMVIYASSLYFIINQKPQWFQSEFKKEIPAWKP